MQTNQTFGAALEAAKNGKAISRIGWNGKNMFVYLNKGSVQFNQESAPPPPGRVEFVEGIRSELFESGDNGTVLRLPNLNMQSATGSTVTGWLASQTDLLAEDWCIRD